MDAPLHFIEGAAGTEQLPLDVLIGPCEVVADQGFAERVLIKDAPEFDRTGARALVEQIVRLVGVDRMSVGDEEAHRVLLDEGVVVVERLELSAVGPGAYELYCLPLRLVGSDGAPARAILVRR